MASRKGDRRRSGARGWISALAWVFLLCAVGFATGIGLGLFVENPELVAKHARGATDEIRWSKDAVPPSQGVDGTPAIGKKLVAEAAVRRPGPPGDVAKPEPIRGGFLIQVGAFQSAEAAEQQVASLRQWGFSARVFPATTGARSSWRVRLGPYPSRERAQKLARQIESKGVSTWVLANDGDPGSS